MYTHLNFLENVHWIVVYTYQKQVHKFMYHILLNWYGCVNIHILKAIVKSFLLIVYYHFPACPNSMWNGHKVIFPFISHRQNLVLNTHVGWSIFASLQQRFMDRFFILLWHSGSQGICIDPAGSTGLAAIGTWIGIQNVWIAGLADWLNVPLWHKTWLPKSSLENKSCPGSMQQFKLRRPSPGSASLLPLWLTCSTVCQSRLVTGKG